MRMAVEVVAVALAALVGALLAGMLVLPVGLVLHEAVAWPLTLGVAAAFGALAAGWTAALVGRPVRLLALVGSAELAAAAAAVAYWSPIGRTVERAVQTNVGALLLYLALLGVGTTAAVWRLPPAGDERRGRTTAAVAAAAVLAVPATLVVASAFGLTGA